MKDSSHSLLISNPMLFFSNTRLPNGLGRKGLRSPRVNDKQLYWVRRKRLTWLHYIHDLTSVYRAGKGACVLIHEAHSWSPYPCSHVLLGVDGQPALPSKSSITQRQGPWLTFLVHPSSDLATMHYHNSCTEMFSQFPIRRPCALKCSFKPNDEFSPSHPHSFACDQLHNFKSSWPSLGMWLEAKKRVCLDATQPWRVTIIALGSLVPCLIPVSELVMISALFTFQVSAHSQRLISQPGYDPTLVTRIQSYLILWASVSSFVEWDNHVFFAELLWRLRKIIHVKHLSLCLAHSMISINSDNDNNNRIKV